MARQHLSSQGRGTSLLHCAAVRSLHGSSRQSPSPAGRHRSCIARRQGRTLGTCALHMGWDSGCSSVGPAHIQHPRSTLEIAKWGPGTKAAGVWPGSPVPEVAATVGAASELLESFWECEQGRRAAADGPSSAALSGAPQAPAPWALACWPCFHPYPVMDLQSPPAARPHPIELLRKRRLETER